VADKAITKSLSCKTFQLTDKTLKNSQSQKIHRRVLTGIPAQIKTFDASKTTKKGAYTLTSTGLKAKTKKTMTE